MKKQFIIVSILIIVAFVAASIAQKEDVYKRPIQVERSKNFDVIHYRVTANFDLDKKVFNGTNEVTLLPLEDDFNTCVFDAEDLVITKVTNSKNQPLKFEHKDHKLAIQFNSKYAYGQEVKFTIV